MSELLTTARPYAKALFKTAKDQSTLDEYFEMLNNLNLVVNEEEVKNIFFINMIGGVSGDMLIGGLLSLGVQISKINETLSLLSLLKEFKFVF